MLVGGGGRGGGGTLAPEEKICKLNNNVCFIKILYFLTKLKEATSSTAAVMD
jgi:hypothetical protein